jgi:hypothetical protein
VDSLHFDPLQLKFLCLEPRRASDERILYQDESDSITSIRFRQSAGVCERPRSGGQILEGQPEPFLVLRLQVSRGTGDLEEHVSVESVDTGELPRHGAEPRRAGGAIGSDEHGGTLVMGPE